MDLRCPACGSDKLSPEEFVRVAGNKVMVVCGSCHRLFQFIEHPAPRAESGSPAATGGDSGANRPAT